LRNAIDNNMKFVDLKNYKFVLEPRYYFYGWSSSSRILGRVSAVKALVKARTFLPEGYNFKIWDCYRPRRIQIKMLESFRKRLHIIYPTLSPLARKKRLFTFGGYPHLRISHLGTHRRGGAFDLIIVDRARNELYMGSDHDDLTGRAETDYFENKKRLTLVEKIAKKNRRLLKRVMRKAKFMNYSPEWWHWSFNK